MWQYSRDFIQLQPAQAQTVPIPLDDDIAGQGQILSLVFATWDPTLNSGNGGFTPSANYALLELLYGSSVEIFQDTPASNQYTWLMLHGSTLPLDVFGFDLMLTEDGRLTNENALNTLVQAGAQLRITYVNGQAPAAGSTIYVGIEALKKVGS
jgi:hypothetical protein